MELQNTTRTGAGLRILTALLVGIALCTLAGAVARANGGTTLLTRTTTMTNPCNGELVTGPVDVLLVVQANDTENGPHVIVHRSFHGRLQGSQGNEYQVRSIGQDTFDALASSYVLDFENNVIGKGSAPNFTFTGRMRVFVDADQNPTTYAAIGTGSDCK